MDADLLAKAGAQVGTAEVAYLDAGAGPAVVLLHGCPFSAFVWRHIIALLAPRWRCVAAQLDPANQRHTVEVATELTKMTVPTLVVWGGQDVHFPPSWAHRLHTDIPGARLEILPTAGHLLMEEQPTELAALLTDFLTTHAAW
jgi:pimeloyl-ACP methyl ester carboxylesterase